MCLIRKKIRKEVIEGNKFSLGDKVAFKVKDELLPGYIYKIKKINGEIFYDVQIGGECPIIKEDIAESRLHLRK